MYVCAWGGRSVCLRRHYCAAVNPKHDGVTGRSVSSVGTHPNQTRHAPVLCLQGASSRSSNLLARKPHRLCDIIIHTPCRTTVNEYHPTTGGTPRVSVPACCTHVYGVASVDDSLATSSRYASNQRLVGSLRWHAAHCQLLALHTHRHNHRHNHRHSHKDKGNHSPSVEGMGGWKKPPHDRSMCHGMPRGGVELHRGARVWRSEREVRIWTLDPHFRQKLRHQLHTDRHMRCCHNAHQALRNRHGHRRNAHAHVGRRGRSRLHHASGSTAAACSRRSIASAPSRCASTSTR